MRTAEAVGTGEPVRDQGHAVEKPIVPNSESGVPHCWTAAVAVNIRCCPSYAEQNAWLHPFAYEQADVDDGENVVRRLLQGHSEVALRRADTGQSSSNPETGSKTTATAPKPPLKWTGTYCGSMPCSL